MTESEKREISLYFLHLFTRLYNEYQDAFNEYFAHPNIVRFRAMVEARARYEMCRTIETEVFDLIS